MSTETHPSAWTSAKGSLFIFAISVSLALYTSAYETAVVPLLGDVPTHKYLNYVVQGSTALGLALPKLSTSKNLILLGVLTFLTPYTSYWVGAHAARLMDPIKSPLITHLSILAPIIALAVSLAMSIDARLAMLVLAANALQLRPLLELAANMLSLEVTSDTIFTVLGSISAIVWTWQKIGTEEIIPRKGQAGKNNIQRIRAALPMIIPFVAFILPRLLSPTLSGHFQFPFESPAYPLRILFSKQSITGLIVVGELPPPLSTESSTALHSIRYLRASHSILGGVWTDDKIVTLDNDEPPLTDEAGTPLGDSIYSAFVLQEAARLVNSTSLGKAEPGGNALVIGLGAGISATAFSRHGISPTIVEIDPAVYDAARHYFGLPDFGQDRVFLEDARRWVSQRQTSIGSFESHGLAKYNIVVHDCFSGGGVPEHLFSMEFFTDLKALMTPEGVIAVNFAGKLASDASRAVLTTLLKVFGQCRAFHDSVESVSEEQFYSDFINLVFFCSASSVPLTFRTAVKDDYLNSYLRRHILSSLPEREVALHQIRGSRLWSGETEERFLLTDANNKLNEWQRDEALDHWKLMRELLPATVWETY
ncbi:S-adenosyl-L-methionine-dependent methyltransferase [Hygrophoropsis aurantiaca]|uniref:S-adenosyl-L-methionine-dependent methyltransferase n=1 Tax=Hygrophoropsis aurantiaca TaxID=72124 RepID=A0ACB8ARS6_9AGAM|nr:S-adenosyl-L-methionine-dependent methyltransferase [Hygrophoropsis aurantiaca]